MNKSQHPIYNILLGIFYYFPENHRQYRNNNPSEIHHFFKTSLQQHPIISLKFSGSPIAPYSEELDQTLFIMQMSNIISSWGPDYDPAEFKPLVKEKFEEIKTKFTPPELMQIQQISQKFFKRFGLENHLQNE